MAVAWAAGCGGGDDGSNEPATTATGSEGVDAATSPLELTPLAGPLACPPMDDLGAPGSYMTLEEGVEVYSSDGQAIGKVAHVLADPDLDLFDGFVIDHSAMPGGHRFCDADQVDEIFERGVVLTAGRGGSGGAAEAERESRRDRDRPRRRRPRRAPRQAAPGLGSDLREGLSARCSPRRSPPTAVHDPEAGVLGISPSRRPPRARRRRGCRARRPRSREAEGAHHLDQDHHAGDDRRRPAGVEAGDPRRSSSVFDASIEHIR